MMRRFTVIKNEAEDWRRKNILSIYVLCNEKRCSLVIDEGSAMNVISTHTLTRVNLNMNLILSHFMLVG